MNPTPPPKRGEYFATQLSGLRNGSFYRCTSASKPEYAHYTGGHFMNFRNDLPDGLNIRLSEAEGQKELPQSML